ncbi:hypothetical protein SprV_0200717500 [Sparganum proliferum]
MDVRVDIVETRIRLNQHRSPQDNPRSNRPERRTALVAREMACYKVDITALIETPFSEQAHSDEMDAGHTFFWSGHPKAEQRDAGVASTIRNDIMGRLHCMPQGINDRLMSLRPPLRGGKFATIISQRTSSTARQPSSRCRPAAAANENASAGNRWCQLRDPVQSTALAVLGRARRQHQDWFDDNDAAISNLLAENRLHKAYVNRPPTKTALLSTVVVALYSSDCRWAEHFRCIVNRPSGISDAAIARLPQLETNADLDLPSSLHETIRAVQQLSSGKASGSDAIPAEVYKHGGPQLMDHLTALLQEMWRQGEVPQDFKDATTVHLYKRKRNHQLCDSHQGISLLSTVGKIFALILINRLNNHLEQCLLPESQRGFRRHRGTTGMIFAAHQLQEKCQEMRTHLHSTFMDPIKAFDTVNRDGLWKIMQKFSCPERFTEMVRQLNDGMMSHVMDNGSVSEAFAVTNGVKQGCVLAHTLFSLMFSVMLMYAYRDESPGIRIAYRTDGHLLNQRRMHFQSRVSTTTVHELLFADDRTLIATSEGGMQRSMDLSYAVCENFGLIINTEKTVVMHQPPPNTAPPPQCAVNQRERNPNASGGQPHVSGQHPPPQHGNQRSGPPDFQNQSNIRSSSKHSLESSRSSAQH